LKKYVYPAMIALLVFFITSCSAKKTGDIPMQSESPVRPSLHWVIAYSGAAFEKDFGAYPAGWALAEKAGVSVEVEAVSGPYGQILLKRLQSGSYPDLLTVAASDNLTLALNTFPGFCDIDTLEHVRPLIPDEIIENNQLDGKLRFIPGGFGAENKNAVSEGLFVNTRLYDALGRKPLASEADFFSALSDYKAYCEKQGVRQRYLPLLANDFSSAAALFEHLFGITPDIKHTDPSAYQPLQQFFTRLGGGGVTQAMLSGANENLSSQMEEALFFAGSADFVRSYNLYHPGTPYQLTDVKFSGRGFLAGYSQNGAFSTYVGSTGAKKEAAEKFLSVMLSEWGSRTAVYGVENQDWLIDDKGQIHLFSGSKNAILSHANRTGIGAFPFLSRIGVCYPGCGESYTVPAADLLPQIRKYRLIPTAAAGIVQTKQEAVLQKTLEDSLHRNEE